MPTTLLGRDNAGQPRQKYANKISAMTEEHLWRTDEALSVLYDHNKPDGTRCHKAVAAGKREALKR